MAELYKAIDGGKALAAFSALLALSTLIDGLDATILNVALPTMSRDFGISIADSSWIPVAYTVAMAALILPFAKIARNGWIREFFIIGTALFTICSFTCALSVSFESFMVSRLIQGTGAAMVTCSIPLMIVYLLPPDRRGRGMATLGLTTGLAVIIGPTLGGMITSYLSWHWAFLINIPIGIITVPWAMRVIPKTGNHSEFRYPDGLNCVLTFLGICLGLIFLQNIRETNLPDWITALCGTCSLLSFCMMAWRSHVRKDTAIISSDMFLKKAFLFLGLALVLNTVIIAGTQYLLPFFLSYCQGYDAAMVGYTATIASVATILLSFPVGRWCDARGCKIPAVGAGLFRLSYALLFAGLAATMTFPVLAVGLALMGASMACAGTGLSTSIIHHTEDAYQDEAATFLMVISSVSSTFGVALTSLVFSFNTGGTPLPHDVLSGFEGSMWFFAVLAVVATILTAVIPNVVPKKEE